MWRRSRCFGKCAPGDIVIGRCFPRRHTLLHMHRHCCGTAGRHCCSSRVVRRRCRCRCGEFAPSPIACLSYCPQHASSSNQTPLFPPKTLQASVIGLVRRLLTSRICFTTALPSTAFEPTLNCLSSCLVRRSLRGLSWVRPSPSAARPLSSTFLSLPTRLGCL